jgi:hypothetical protein
LRESCVDLEKPWKEAAMKRRALCIVLLSLATTAMFIQTRSPVEGVWRISEVVWGGTRPDVTSPQPGLMIFTRGYYSTMTVMGQQPRTAAGPAGDPDNFTDAEKLARYEEWRPFGASSGSYELTGSMLTRRVIVAKNVNVMARGEPTVWEFRAEGPNILWLIPTGDLVATEPRYKLTRLE